MLVQFCREYDRSFASGSKTILLLITPGILSTLVIVWNNGSIAGNWMAVDDDDDVVTGTEGAVGPVAPPFSICDCFEPFPPPTPPSPFPPLPCPPPPLALT